MHPALNSPEQIASLEQSKVNRSHRAWHAKQRSTKKKWLTTTPPPPSATEDKLRDMLASHVTIWRIVHYAAFNRHLFIRIKLCTPECTTPIAAFKLKDHQHLVNDFWIECQNEKKKKEEKINETEKKVCILLSIFSRPPASSVLLILIAHCHRLRLRSALCIMPYAQNGIWRIWQKRKTSVTFLNDVWERSLFHAHAIDAFILQFVASALLLFNYIPSHVIYIPSSLQRASNLTRKFIQVEKENWLPKNVFTTVHFKTSINVVFFFSSFFCGFLWFSLHSVHFLTSYDISFRYVNQRRDECYACHAYQLR